MRRNPRNSSGRRVNPLRELAAEQRRMVEIARNRDRAERLRAELPSLIEDRVGDHIQKLENRLLSDFKEMGQRAMDQSTAVLNEQLGERLETLEQISSIQSRTIVSLRDSSKVADQKVSAVVNSIENTLSNVVPGFRLAAPQHPQPQIETARTEFVQTDPDDPDDAKGKYGFCPNCTSTNVRRANRQGLWEEVLRLFFLAPFRCRACRHKFYRF
jgi:hypothetical protein